MPNVDRLNDRVVIDRLTCLCACVGPLEVRPIHHRLEDRVRSHVLICMLAEYLRWHLRHAWAELLFEDDNPTSNADPAAKATRSREACAKPAAAAPRAAALPHDREPLRRA